MNLSRCMTIWPKGYLVFQDHCSLTPLTVLKPMGKRRGPILEESKSSVSNGVWGGSVTEIYSNIRQLCLDADWRIVTLSPRIRVRVWQAVSHQIIEIGVGD